MRRTLAFRPTRPDALPRESPSRDAHYPPFRPPLAPIAWRGEEVRLLGTVPQTDVLVVPHERNMRSKFR
jgi:hypothetical protein